MTATSPTANAVGAPFAASDWLGPLRSRRLPVVLAIAILALWPGMVGGITRTQLTDAYIQVAAFVAATLNSC